MPTPDPDPASDPDARWAEIASQLEAYRDEVRQAWGDLDGLTLARYLAGEATEDEAIHARREIAGHSRLRECVEILLEVFEMGPETVTVEAGAVEAAVAGEPVADGLSRPARPPARVVSATRLRKIRPTPAPRPRATRSYRHLAGQAVAASLLIGLALTWAIAPRNTPTGSSPSGPPRSRADPGTDSIPHALAPLKNRRPTEGPDHGPALAARDVGPTIRILLASGTEKRGWLDAVTRVFNDSKPTLPSGERVVVEVMYETSGSIAADALERRSRRVHLISPASRAFLIDANGRAAEEGQPDVVDLGEVRELARSPLVIAARREVAEAMGWPGQPIGWRDFFEFVADPGRWEQARNRWLADGPGGGDGDIPRTLKYAHTHPDFSSSGLGALLAEVHAGLDSFDAARVRPDDLRVFERSDFIRRVEAATVLYGESTGFLAAKLFGERGEPASLSAAILHEGLVFEANKARAGLARRPDARGDDANPVQALFPSGLFRPGWNPSTIAGHLLVLGIQASPSPSPKKPPPVVAIYPKEGTFTNDHPIGVVERPWVSGRERQAARVYVDFLTSEPQQRRAIDFGLRPASPVLTGEVEATFRPELGVAPGAIVDIPFPSYSVIKQARTLWRRQKRPADVVLAIDTSGSMVGEKIARAEEAAKQFINQLSDGDTLMPILFDQEVHALPNGPFRMDDAGKKAAKDEIDGLMASGATALYRALRTAVNYLDENCDPGHNRAVVLLSDGKDTQGGIGRDDLLRLLESARYGNIYVITIGYGDGNDLDPETLEMMANKTGARSYRANPKSIQRVFREIVTFF